MDVVIGEFQQLCLVAPAFQQYLFHFQGSVLTAPVLVSIVYKKDFHENASD
jgi:hypothetical protein